MEVNGELHTPSTLTPRKNHQYSIKSRMGGSQSWSRRFLPPSKFEHHTIQPTDSHYRGADLSPKPEPTEKTIERSPFFVRSGGHCCCGDLIGWTIF